MCEKEIKEIVQELKFTEIFVLDVKLKIQTILC